MFLSYLIHHHSQKDPAVLAPEGRSKLSIGHRVARSVIQFFGLPVGSHYRKSRIVKRASKSFDKFIFKGYDQQTPGLFRPGSFKGLKMLCKN